jgi:drug/metabolite transporter (DMT)-like permease
MSKCPERSSVVFRTEDNSDSGIIGAKVSTLQDEKTVDPLVETNRKNAESNLPAYLAVALGVFCIGCSAIFVKIANVEGTVSAFYRLLIATIVVIPVWAVRRPAWPKRQDLGWIALGGLFFAFDLVLWNTGLLLTSAATATLLGNNAPLWVGLGALFLFRERLSGKFWIGLFIALSGMTFIVGGNAWRELRMNSGDLLSIGASLFYAAYLLTTQKVRKSIDTLTFTCLSMATGVIILFPANILFGRTLVGFSAKTWLALIGLGLLSQLTGWLAINKALGRLRAAPVSVSLLFQPVVTAVLGIIFLGEPLQSSDLIGGTFVLAGIFLVNKR